MLRVLLIVVSAFVLAVLSLHEDYLVSFIILLLLILLQTISLIFFVEHTNNKLSKFLESIRHGDFSTSFSDEGLGKSFTNLSRQFNQITDEFKKNRAEKEEHYNYLLTVIQHVSIGIIVFRHDGKIDVFNNQLKKTAARKSPAQYQ